MRTTGLYSPEPFVALVFPIAPRALGQEVHLGQILHHFVPELYGRVEPEWRAMGRVERRTIHTIGKDSLLMQGTLAIPGGPVPSVERTKFHVRRPRISPDDFCHIAQAHAVPRSHRGPAFDAVMAHAHVRACHLL